MRKWGKLLRQMENTQVILLQNGSVVARRSLIGKKTIPFKEAILQCARKAFGEIIMSQLSTHAVRCVVRKTKSRTTIACRLPKNLILPAPSTR